MPAACDSAALKLVEEMGFSTSHAIKALVHSQNDIQLAIERLTCQQEGKEIGSAALSTPQLSGPFNFLVKEPKFEQVSNSFNTLMLFSYLGDHAEASEL